MRAEKFWVEHVAQLTHACEMVLDPNSLKYHANEAVLAQACYAVTRVIRVNQ